MNEAWENARKTIESAQRIMVIQAENPDGDSLGSSLAFEEILGDMGKTVSLHCAVDIPKYLRYTKGWDRVELDFDAKADMAIIVDTVSDTLLSKTLEIPGARAFFESHPVLVLDHHGSVESSLPFDHMLIVDKEAVATGEALYRLAADAEWKVNSQAAESMLIAMLSDSLGFTTPNTTARSFYVASKLIELGATPSEIETRRREFMKKSPEILEYKGKLIERIEYALEGKLATVHIPWEDIQAYSDQYNPSVLVLDEMRMVNDVEVAVAIKTYPDGKLTGKLRTNAPIADKIAGFFGGGGHKYAAGFRIYDNYDTLCRELISATDKILKEYRENAENL
jgi:bifunctional oligoribonuclease and PAP phosphatase NrnA